MRHVFLGWDSRENDAYEVARSSILRRSNNVEVHPIRLNDPIVKELLKRPIEYKDGKMWCPISQAPMSTEFAISRFLVPWLHWPRKSWALFADCDVLCLSDINELFDLADDKYALMCVKHNHNPVETVKMDGQIQTKYSRKNWSSVMLYNCAHDAHRRLSIDDVNSWPGRDLHAMKWLKDEEIGSLPQCWNHLVSVTQDSEPPKLAHFTLGGPWLTRWEGGPLDDLWTLEKDKRLY